MSNLTSLMLKDLEAAKILIRSGLIPKYLKSPEQVVVVMAKGRELRLGPMQSLEQIYVVDNVPALRGQLMLDLIRRSFPNARIYYDWSKAPQRVSVHAARSKHDDLQVFTWDLDMASHLLHKPCWKHYPRTMLTWRCVAEMARFLFPDALNGCLYTPEELGADTDVDGIPTDIDVPNRLKAARPGGDVPFFGGMDSLSDASSETIDMPQTQDEPEMAQELEVDVEPEEMLYDEQPMPTEDEASEQLSPEMAWKLLDEKKAKNLFCLRYVPEKRLFLFRWTYSEELNNLFSLKSGQLSYPFVVNKNDWSRETNSFSAAKEALEKAQNILPSSWTFACSDLEKIEVEHKLPQLVKVMTSEAVGFKLDDLEVLLAAPKATWGKAQMKDLEDVTRMLKKKNPPQQNKEIVTSYLSQRL